jgi:hypothetical protein
LRKLGEAYSKESERESVGFVRKQGSSMTGHTKHCLFTQEAGELELVMSLVRKNSSSIEKERGVFLWL